MMRLIDYIKNIKTLKHRTVFNESYEEFYNKTKKSYDEYIESFYEHKEIYRRFNFKVDDESYETQIQDLYETLLSSSSNKYFIDCFRQKFRSDFVRAYIPTYIDDHKVDGYVKLKVKKSFDEESDRFKSFLNVHNYYIVKIDEEIAYKIIYVERYIQDNYTNEVYETYNGILYHVTTKYKKDKILKFGLHPKGNEYEKSHVNLVGFGNKDVKHPKRLYFFANKKHSETLYSTLYNKIDEICVLRIDLKKYKNTIRFFRDDSFTDLRSIFTYEPIPPYCISEVNNKNVLMNNDIFVSLVNKIKKLFKNH